MTLVDIEKNSIAELADIYRASAYSLVSNQDRIEKGQFFTPISVARFMADFFSDPPREISLLDPGAGVGMLTAAFIEDACQRSSIPTPESINVVVFEPEANFSEHLHQVLTTAQHYCRARNISLDFEVLPNDFIEAASNMIDQSLFSLPKRTFNRIIINPPYKKINSKSKHRQYLRSAGIETSNLYTGFLALAVALLEPGGELVAITPRSFCNGPYFKPFRRWFLDSMTLRRIHMFDTRDRAFSEDDVLQENVIVHAVKTEEKGIVEISTSRDPNEEGNTILKVSHDRVVNPQDPNLFFHIASNELGCVDIST